MPRNRLVAPGVFATAFARTTTVVAAVLAAGVWLGHRIDPTWTAAAATRRSRPVPVTEFWAIDQDGRQVSRASLVGHPWVADFIFTSCAGVCPVLTAKLSALRREIADPDVRFVSFSIDPGHDTPAVLKAYAARWDGQDPRWRLLHADPGTLARLGTSLGARGAGGLHNDRFFLVDAGGAVRGSFQSGDPQLRRRLEMMSSHAE